MVVVVIGSCMAAEDNIAVGTVINLLLSSVAPALKVDPISNWE